MKKITSIFAALTVFSLFFSACATTEAVASEEATTESTVAIQAPAEPVELVFGEDYILEPVFGTELFYVGDTNIEFYEGCSNNNHAILFRLLNPEAVIIKDYKLVIEYEMGNFDSAKSCQLVIQAADNDKADYSYSNCSYPILYNNFEETSNTMIIDMNMILRSSVKESAVGFRMLCNTGSYERYTWQDDWSFNITKVCLVPEN